MRRTIVILTAAGLLMPLAAHALNERAWLMLNGGAGTYVMTDLNAEIDAVNAASGLTFSRVENGHSYGLAIGFETVGRWNFGLGLDRLAASTKASDPSGTYDYRFDANAWRAFGEYALRPVGHSTVFVGGAVGLIQEQGKLIISSPGTAPEEFKIRGTDPSYEGYLGGNWWPTPRFALTAQVGYRYARVKEVKLEGATFIMSNGEAMTLDFSGPSVRLGIKLAAGDSGM